MSLDFDVSTVKNFKVITTIHHPDGSAHWHPITNALIWASIPVGMNEITEKNWVEFYNRLNAVEKVSGPYVWRGDLDKHDPRNRITKLEVFMHIGLHTNASNKTLPQFRENLYSLSCMDNFGRTVANPTPEMQKQYEELGLEKLSSEEWDEAWTFGIDVTNPDTASRLKYLRSPEYEQVLLEKAEEKAASQ